MRPYMMGSAGYSTTHPRKNKYEKSRLLSDGFAFVHTQPSLLSLRVILLFLLAALFRCSRPRAAALSTALTATL